MNEWTELKNKKDFCITHINDIQGMIDELVKKQRAEIIKALRHDVIANASIDRARAFNNEEGVNVIAETYWHQFVVFPFLAMHYAFDDNAEMYTKAPGFKNRVKNGLKRLGWFTASLIATATCILPVVGCISHLTHKALDYVHAKKSLQYKHSIDVLDQELVAAKAELKRIELLEKQAKQEARKAEKAAKAAKKTTTAKKTTSSTKKPDDEIVK